MRKVAVTPDLFKVCRRFFPPHVASVAAYLLFWSQFAQHVRHGRTWFFKQDADLVEEFGKHAKSMQRAVRQVCAQVGKERPEALFLMTHRPKPWAKSGRVRWLSRTPRGDELLNAAQEFGDLDRRKNRGQIDARDGYRIIRSATAKHSPRTPQDAPTYIIHKNSPDTRSRNLSLGRKETTKPSKQDCLQEEVLRLVQLWEKACTETHQETLIWTPTDVRRWASKLAELTQVLRFDQLSDKEILERLRLLAGDLKRFEFVMGSRFMEYNLHGLMIESFARYGQKLWRAAQAELDEEDRQRKQNDLLKKTNMIS